MANEITRKAMRSWFRSIILKGLVGVVSLNLADAILLRTNLPFLLQAALAVVIVLGTIVMFGQAISYVRYSLAQHVLMNAQWEPATGAARRVFLAGVPIGWYGIMTSDRDDWLLARRLYPSLLARQLPDELEEENLVVAARGRRHVYSLKDGSTPVYARRVHPRKLARAYRNVVLQQ